MFHVPYPAICIISTIPIGGGFVYLLTRNAKPPMPFLLLAVLSIVSGAIIFAATFAASPRTPSGAPHSVFPQKIDLPEEWGPVVTQLYDSDWKDNAKIDLFRIVIYGYDCSCFSRCECLLPKLSYDQVSAIVNNFPCRNGNFSCGYLQERLNGVLLGCTDIQPPCG